MKPAKSSNKSNDSRVVPTNDENPKVKMYLHTVSSDDAGDGEYRRRDDEQQQQQRRGSSSVSGVNGGKHRRLSGEGEPLIGSKESMNGEVYIPPSRRGSGTTGYIDDHDYQRKLGAAENLNNDDEHVHKPHYPPRRNSRDDDASSQQPHNHRSSHKKKGSSTESMDPEVAATKLQARVRGGLARENSEFAKAKKSKKV
jgi:hypothetical protein